MRNNKIEKSKRSVFLSIYFIVVGLIVVMPSIFFLYLSIRWQLFLIIFSGFGLIFGSIAELCRKSSAKLVLLISSISLFLIGLVNAIVSSENFFYVNLDSVYAFLLKLNIFLGIPIVILIFKLFRKVFNIIFFIGLLYTFCLIGLVEYPTWCINNFNNKIDKSASWVKTNHKIYFKQENKLCSINIDGSNFKELVNLKGHIYKYYFSPNRKYILINARFSGWLLVTVDNDYAIDVIKVEKDLCVIGWAKDNSGIVFEKRVMPNSDVQVNEKENEIEEWVELVKEGNFIYNFTSKNIYEIEDLSEEDIIKFDSIKLKSNSFPIKLKSGKFVYNKISILGLDLRRYYYFYDESKGLPLSPCNSSPSAEVIYFVTKRTMSPRWCKKQNLFTLPPGKIYAVNKIPNSSYVILEYNHKILILDAKNNKIANITEGSDAFWFEPFLE